MIGMGIGRVTSGFMQNQAQQKIAESQEMLKDIENNPQNGASTRSAAAAALQMGLSMVNGIASDIATSSAAQKQLEATQDTNATNYKIWQEQLAYAKEQYLRELEDARADMLTQRNWSLEDRDYENKYNSPLEQVKRYRAAGLNPFLMMNGQNAVGSVSANIPSRNSVSMAMPGAPQMQVPNYGLEMQGYLASMNMFSSVIGQMADLAFQRDKLDQEFIVALNNDKNLSPETKNWMIKHKYFKGDKRDEVLWQTQEQVFHQTVMKTAMDELMLNFQAEMNDEQRKQWNRNQELHDKTIDKIRQEISTLDAQGRLFNTQGDVSQQALEQIKYEVEQLEGWKKTAPSWLQNLVFAINKTFGGTGAGALLRFFSK